MTDNHNPRILLIDDEPSIREPLTDYLSAQGFAVTDAANAAEARSVLRAQSIDLVVAAIPAPGPVLVRPAQAEREIDVGLRQEAFQRRLHQALAAEPVVVEAERVDAVQARLLGCLVEKEATTPDTYPLTVNAAQSAANQKTAREPVMNVSAGSVEHALRQLETLGLARQHHATLVAEVVRMLCAGVVHGDLSEFNILLGTHEGQPWPVIIDLPQAVDAAGNNNAFAMLERDVRNLAEYFGQFAPELLDTRYAKEIWAIYEAGELVPDSHLTGEFEEDEAPADLDDLLREIMDARDEEERRKAAASQEEGDDY